jgi:hypothetical protein
VTTERTPTANMRLASCGVTCLNSSSVFQLGFSAGLTVLSSEIPHERQAPNRYPKLLTKPHRLPIFWDKKFIKILTETHYPRSFQHFAKIIFYLAPLADHIDPPSPRRTDPA